MVVAEVGLTRAGRDDKTVVGRLVGVVEQLGDDALVGEVDVGDVAQQHLDIALPAQHHAGCRGDLALRQNPGGHLVQQRLEQVMSGPGDQFDVDVGVLEFFAALSPPKPEPMMTTR